MHMKCNTDFSQRKGVYLHHQEVLNFFFNLEIVYDIDIERFYEIIL